MTRQTLRARIDAGFAALARNVYRHRIKTLVGIALVVGVLLLQLPKLKSDNSTENFFRSDDPNMVLYNAFREQFGRDEVALVLVRGETVFDRAFLERLVALHKALESEVPHLRSVTSLANARDTRGEADRLVVEDLLKELPGTPAAMATLRKRVLTSHLYPNLYISEDGRVTALVVESVAHSQVGQNDASFEAAFADRPGKASAFTPLTEAENGQMVSAIRQVARRFEAPGFQIHLTGSPVVSDYFDTAIARDVALFMSLAFLSFTVLLLVLFRRFSGALLPLLIVMLGLGSTMGLMALTGTPFSSVTSILPSFMMSVGVGTAVHVLAIFYRRFEEHGDKERAVVETFGHSGLPVVMTALTTIAGLLSFSTAGMVPVAHLGLFGGAGVFVILLFALLALPAVIALLPLRRRPRVQGKGDALADRILAAIAGFATGHPRAIVLGSVAILAVSAAGLANQGFSQHFSKWLPASSPQSVALRLADTELKGASTLEFVIDTHRENGLYEPAVLERMEKLERSLLQARDASGEPVVGKVTSVLDVLRETNQALNENRPGAYRLPGARALTAQELLLFENSGSDDLQRLVDSRFSKARLSAKVHDKDAAAYTGFVSEQQAYANALFAGVADVGVTGTLKLWSETLTLVMESMARSYLIAGLAITLLMVLMMGSLRIGLLTMIPNFFPVIVVLGAMGWLGIRLDMSNMLLGTIAIGLAVDDTIHFFHNFRRYYAELGETTEAVRRTLLSTGRAMVFSTLVLATGFGLFAFASLNNLIQFGVLIAATLLLALLADILLSPAMLVLLLRTAYGRDLVRRWGGFSAGQAAPAPQIAGLATRPVAD